MGFLWRSCVLFIAACHLRMCHIAATRCDKYSGVMAGAELAGHIRVCLAELVCVGDPESDAVRKLLSALAFAQGDSMKKKR